MSIILKGIDLPKEGLTTNVNILSNGDIYVSAFDGKRTNYGVLRNSSIQIPKGHGRIIDEKELKTKIHDVTLEGGVLHGCIDKTVIHEVPTILEAEEE